MDLDWVWEVGEDFAVSSSVSLSPDQPSDRADVGTSVGYENLSFTPSLSAF